MKGEKEDKVSIQPLAETVIAAVIALNSCIRVD